MKQIITLVALFCFISSNAQDITYYNGYTLIKNASIKVKSSKFSKTRIPLDWEESIYKNDTLFHPSHWKKKKDKNNKQITLYEFNRPKRDNGLYFYESDKKSFWQKRIMEESNNSFYCLTDVNMLNDSLYTKKALHLKEAIRYKYRKLILSKNDKSIYFRGNNILIKGLTKEQFLILNSSTFKYYTKPPGIKIEADRLKNRDVEVINLAIYFVLNNS